MKCPDECECRKAKAGDIIACDYGDTKAYVFVKHFEKNGWGHHGKEIIGEKICQSTPIIKTLGAVRDNSLHAFWSFKQCQIIKKKATQQDIDNIHCISVL